jgi:hypothetical protein
MRMHEDITDILALEVKKEMADRYFGFRKLIEEDIKEYDSQVLNSFLRLERKIGTDLVRLYILLKDENLIHEFFQLAGLDQLIFYDPYLSESPTLRARVFAGLKIRGLTRASRFRNMIFDIYEALGNDISQYRQNLTKLAIERDSIAEEIKLFNRKHNLGVMMDFLRDLDGSSGHQAGDMGGGLVQQSGEVLEQKLRFQPPPPVDELLPVIPQIVPLPRLKEPFKRIVTRSFLAQGRPDLKELVRL